MTESIPTRRHFNRSSLISLLAAMGMPDGTAVVQQQANSNAATRRDVIKQELPGEPFRDISLIEVTYPPATGSPPHRHANGVMAFIVSGSIVSNNRRWKRGDVPCRRCLVGTPRRNPSDLAQCELDRAGDAARNLRRT